MELTIQLSIAILSLIILILATLLVTSITCLIHEKKKRVELFPAKQVDPSTIYEEVDSRPQDVMEENMAYNSGVQLQQRKDTS